MVRSGPFEVQVCVAGVPVQEHVTPTGAVYVETVRLAHPAPRARALAAPAPRGRGAPSAAAVADARWRQRFDTPATYMQEVVEHDPYGERFTQRWPVTPYTLLVTNRSDEHVQAVVSIDGAKASRQFVSGGATTEIKGFKDRSRECGAAAAAARAHSPALTRRARAALRRSVSSCSRCRGPCAPVRTQSSS
jgi:hypothetical protein